MNSPDNEKKAKLGPKSLMYSPQSMINLKIRDDATKAVVMMDAPRGIEERDHATNFLLVGPLTVGIIGGGYKGGQPISGVEGGPKAIRDAGLLPAIWKLGWEVEDFGDLEFQTIENDPTADNGVKHPRQVGSACEKIFDTVYKHAVEGKLMLTLGGDHSLAIGTIAAACKAWKDTVVVWVDAHGDINTPATSPSGNIHGMPVAFLMGLVKGEVPGFEWLHPCLTPDRIVYIGLRDVDFGEKKILREQGIKVFSMTEVDKFGIGKVMEMALDHVNPKRDKPIHLSYDVDGIDPQVIPSTGTRVRGGLSYREARHICEAVSETGRLVSLDIVEVNPAIGTPKDVEETASVAVDLVKSALGRKLW